MQWRNPELRLDANTIYDLLVVRGLDDWLQPADFFDVARYAHPQAEEEYRSAAVALAKRLLYEGHAVAGDLSHGEHRPWAATVDEQWGRLSALWSDTEVDPRFAFVWFDLTDSGRTWAEAALERVPELD